MLFKVNTKTSNKFWIVASTLIIIGLCFIYYFLSYVPSNKKLIDQQGFRILGRTESNIISLKNVFTNNVQNKQYEAILNNPSNITLINSGGLQNLNQIFNKVYVNKRITPIHVTTSNQPVSQLNYDRNLNHLVLTQSHKDSANNLYDIQFSIQPESFFSDALHPYTFSEYILLLSGEVAYSSFNLGYQLNPDSIHHFNTSGIIRDVVLDQNKFKGFTRKFTLSDSLQCTIIGLQEARQYKSSIYSVENLWIIYISLALLITVISLPLLKLLFMNKYERLYLNNVYFGGLSILLMASSFFILFFTAYFYLSDKSTEVDQKLVAMSQTLKEEFEQKVNNSYNLLSQMDSSQTDNNPVFSGASKKLTGIYNVERKLKSNFPNLYQPQYGFAEDFSALFWMDKKGIVKKVITLNDIKSDSDFINLSKRTYFSDVVENKMIFAPESNDKKLAFQSIKSWADGVNEVGIGIQSKQHNNRYAVIGLSTKFSGIMDIALPPDFSFCIIDRKGEVLIHSDPSRNLSENFIDESNKDSELLSAMDAKVNKKFDLKYSGNQHRAYITPVHNMPYYIVALKNMNTYRSGSALKIIIAFSLNAVLYIILSLVLALNTLYNFKFSKLKVKKFRLSWLKPKKGAGLKYLVLMVTLILFTLTCLILCSASSENYIIFFITYFNLLGMYVTVLVLNQKSKNAPITISVFVFPTVAFLVLNIPIYIAILFTAITLCAYVFYHKIYQKVNTFVKEKFTQPLNLIGKSNIDKKLENAIKESDNLFSKQYLTNYHRFIFIWVLLVSIFPCMYFIQISNDIVDKTWAKYKLLNYQASCIAIQDDLHTNFKNLDNNTGFLDRKISKITLLDSCFNISKFKELSEQHLIATSKEDSVSFGNRVFQLNQGNIAIKDVIFYLHFNLNPLIGKARSFVYNHTDNGDWNWGYYISSNDKAQYYVLETHESDVQGAQRQVYYSILKPPFRAKLLDFGVYEGLLTISCLLLAIILYRSILFCSKRLFATEFQNYKSTSQLSHTDLLELTGKNLIIVGLPHSGKTMLIEELKKDLQEAGTVYQHLDLIDCISKSTEVPSIEENCQYFILQNFDYDKSNLDSTRLKLKLLESLVNYKNNQKKLTVNIILFSEIHPGHLTDHFTLVKPESEEDVKNKNNEKFLIKEKWNRLLGAFSKAYLPLKKEITDTNLKLITSFIDSHKENISDVLRLNKLITNEMKYADLNPGELKILLDRMQAVLFEDQDTHFTQHQVEENVILLIQSYLQPYYQSIWNTFTLEEKFLVFDLAQNKFANVKNERIIQVLLEKGLFVYKNGIKLFSKSFNNYVLSVIKDEEKNEMQRILVKKGSWSVVYVIILILILSIGIFLSFSQKELLNNINAAISSIIAFAGLLLRYLGLFSVNTKK